MLPTIHLLLLLVMQIWELCYSFSFSSIPLLFYLYHFVERKCIFDNSFLFSSHFTVVIEFTNLVVILILSITLHPYCMRWLWCNDWFILFTHPCCSWLPRLHSSLLQNPRRHHGLWTMYCELHVKFCTNRILISYLTCSLLWVFSEIFVFYYCLLTLYEACSLWRFFLQRRVRMQ